MKKIHMMIVALLAMLMPTTLWAGGTAYHYARVTVKVSTASNGRGLVYVGNSSATTAGTFAESSQAQDGGKNCSGISYTFKAFAQANESYEFTGWSETDGGTIIANSSVSPWTTPLITAPDGAAPSSGSKEYFTDKTYYANFKKKVLPSFNITFETSSDGSYTVDGAAPANKTGLTEATTVNLHSDDPNFLCWLVDGNEASLNRSYSPTFTTSATIGASFLTADQVTSVTTLADLTAALANSAYKKITIPSGSSILVPSGTTVTIPSGKQLGVDGTLDVVGKVTNNGTISGNGTLHKVSVLITQGEVITRTFPTQ